ncbi:MnmC family methyltransferase [Hydrogenimonas thermophila]|uniref:tRNA (5-methylaminomethyl-2-thiouridine)(34)-methyltransferase MnmD n=1 Tax=Hydrogenimonas thermophila TaxID=223786 RepID=UPI002937467F|nr:MnmC family methyltransferase [Hydrogenimonas thermophila]WOE70101.1 MnmC family methyltransferase [Hydrogenimonas thermophila]WOE72618.1 MnmC family methyltransferase [Hydrogenimonas thermophila]
MEFVETADGSYTCHSEQFDECYHSTKDGAFKESLKKHIEPAFTLIDSSKKELTILDICFGLGYNTLTTLYYVNKNVFNYKLHIVSPEFDEFLVRSLDKFPYPEPLQSFKPIVSEISKNGCYEDENIRINVVFGDAREFLKRTDLTFDIVYQDAFSPKKNPLLWTKEYFADLSKHLTNDAIVTTYSLATPVRMGMVENSLFVYEPPSSGVRSGTIASPSSNLPLNKIDMALKKERNPNAAPLYDKDFKEQ